MLAFTLRLCTSAIFQCLLQSPLPPARRPKLKQVGFRNKSKDSKTRDNRPSTGSGQVRRPFDLEVGTGFCVMCCLYSLHLPVKAVLVFLLPLALQQSRPSLKLGIITSLQIAGGVFRLHLPPSTASGVTPVAGFVFGLTLPIYGLSGVSRAQC